MKILLMIFLAVFLVFLQTARVQANDVIIITTDDMEAFRKNPMYEGETLMIDYGKCNEFDRDLNANFFQNFILALASKQLSDKKFAFIFQETLKNKYNIDLFYSGFAREYIEVCKNKEEIK